MPASVTFVAESDREAIGRTRLSLDADADFLACGSINRDVNLDV